MDKLKYILCGIATILFGNLVIDLNGIWLPILGTVRFDIIGFLIGIVGFTIVIKYCHETK